GRARRLQQFRWFAACFASFETVLASLIAAVCPKPCAVAREAKDSPNAMALKQGATNPRNPTPHHYPGNEAGARSDDV
ncbi:hypothetical protein SB751_35525, partial [Cupriavidus sp. SIMBA_020]|uniref:hypothetical protein n=1 Tax=Cupriavidus sp. SIMBA_020 TaxID=3085766 RepID=UPI00397829F8